MSSKQSAVKSATTRPPVASSSSTRASNNSNPPPASNGNNSNPYDALTASLLAACGEPAGTAVRTDRTVDDELRDGVMAGDDAGDHRDKVDVTNLPE